jgi:hypothetical protein
LSKTGRDGFIGRFRPKSAMNGFINDSAKSLKIDIFFSSFSNLSINYRGPTPLEPLVSARPEIWKNEITGHQKNKIPVAATLG